MSPKASKLLSALASAGILGTSLAYSPVSQAFDFGNMMNPSKWMGGGRDRYDDDYYDDGPYGGSYGGPYGGPYGRPYGGYGPGPYGGGPYAPPGPYGAPGYRAARRRMRPQLRQPLRRPPPRQSQRKAAARSTRSSAAYKSWRRSSNRRHPRLRVTGDRLHLPRPTTGAPPPHSVRWARIEAISVKSPAIA